jgi:hypothetical protein
MHNKVLETAHCSKLATKHDTDTITGGSSNSIFFRLFCQKIINFEVQIIKKKPYGFKEFFEQLYITLYPRYERV